MDEIKKYYRDLTATLNSNDVGAMREFIRRHAENVLYMPDDAVVESTLRKLQVNVSGVYPKLREQAKAWLNDHNMSERIDRVGREE